MTNKTGTSMSGIINTRKSKKNRTMIRCNCKVCVNHQKDGCRFGWEPINGKCNRFGKNHYVLTKEEKEEARRQTKINREQIRKANSIKKTNLELLSNALDTKITRETIESCVRTRYLGNGKFGIKLNKSPDPSKIRIMIRYRNGKISRFELID